jgi:hypothetical protein
MSFDVLLLGKLRGQLTEGTASNGNPFGRFKLGVIDKKGEGLLASCITFAPAALAIVARLDEGDSVAISGEAAVTTWVAAGGATRAGLDVTVAAVMTAFHASRKRGSQPEKGGAE